MTNPAFFHESRAWLGRPTVCSAVWVLLITLTVASVVPHWLRFAREPAPIVPHIIETLIGPDVRGSYIKWSFVVFVKDDGIALFDHDDPYVGSLNQTDFYSMDEVHSGWVKPRTEWRGLWWPSVVTRGYEVFYSTGFPQRAGVDRTVHGWAATIPRLGGLPERTTRVTHFLLADMFMLALTVLAFMSTRHWVRAKRLVAANRSKYCASCGYSLSGLPAPVCPECGVREAGAENGGQGEA